MAAVLRPHSTTWCRCARLIASAVTQAPAPSIDIFMKAIAGERYEAKPKRASGCSIAPDFAGFDETALAVTMLYLEPACLRGRIAQFQQDILVGRERDRAVFIGAGMDTGIGGGDDDIALAH